MSTAITTTPKTTLITADQLQQVIALDETIRQTNREVVEAEKSGNEMLKAIVMAQGMNALRAGLTPLMPVVMELMGTPMGFRTDKDRPRYDEEKKTWDNSKYTKEEVRDVLIVGLLRGFRVVGNEINVIASNFYATKNGMKRLVLEFPGMNKFRIDWGVPSRSEGGALVPAIVTWELNAKPDKLDCQIIKRDGADYDMRITVRVNKGMGSDAIIGKAESKIYRRVYEIITGIELPSVDEDDANTLNSTGTVVPESSPLAGESETTEEAGTSSKEQTVEYDLNEVYRQYLTDLQGVEQITEANGIYDGYFKQDVYHWTPTQRTHGLRDLEKRHEEIRNSRRGKGGTKGQQELSGVK